MPLYLWLKDVTSVTLSLCSHHTYMCTQSAYKIKGHDHMQNTFLQYCGNRAEDSGSRLHNSVKNLACIHRNETKRAQYIVCDVRTPGRNRAIFHLIRSTVPKSRNLPCLHAKSYVYLLSLVKRALLVDSSHRNSIRDDI